MPELETLFVRIETDLSAFKRGMAEVRRETQGFAKEARSTFSGVGTALDLSPFRRELAASEAAAKQDVERNSQGVTWLSKGAAADRRIVPFGNAGQKNKSMKMRPNITIARINKPMSSFGMTRPQWGHTSNFGLISLRQSSHDTSAISQYLSI